MPRRPGLVLVAHHFDAESTHHLQDLASAAGVPARMAPVGFGAYEAVGAAVAELGRERCDAATLVPLMVSTHSRVAQGVAALAHELAQAHRLAIAVAPALDSAPEAVEVLSDRAAQLAEEPRRQAVMLVGHGPSREHDLPTWERIGATLAEGVRERGRFGAVQAGVVRDDAEPAVRAGAVGRLRDRIARLAADSGRSVVVVPWLIGAGHLTRAALPADLAGLEICYDGRPMLPHPALDAWLARQLAVASMVLTRAKPGSAVSLTER